MTLRSIDGDGAAAEPAEPEWHLLFSAESEISGARSRWQTVIATMRAAQTLTEANGHAILRLVMAYFVFDGAADAIAKSGPVRTVKGQQRKTPAWTIMRQAAEMATALEGDLGLSPRRRGSATKVVRRRTVTNPYLRTVD